MSAGDAGAGANGKIKSRKLGRELELEIGGKSRYAPRQKKPEIENDKDDNQRKIYQGNGWTRQHT